MNSDSADPGSEPDPTEADSGILDLMLNSLWWITTDPESEGGCVHRPWIVCPACKSPNLIPVVYGVPCRRILSMAIQGLCELGGFNPGSNSSAWCCCACKYRWGNLRDLEGEPREEYLQTIAFVKMNCELLSDEVIEVSLMNQSQHIKSIRSTLNECGQKRDELVGLVSGGVPPSDWLSAILLKIRRT